MIKIAGPRLLPSPTMRRTGLILLLVSGPAALALAVAALGGRDETLLKAAYALLAVFIVTLACRPWRKRSAPPPP